MSYLDRRHYQLLIAVSHRRQLTQAANDLGLTQPAASHQIREIERRLGITLFKRTGRWMDLTPAAERLLMAGLYAEDTLRKAEFDAVEMDRNSRPTLRIALGNYDNVNWLPAAVEAVERVNPQARIEVTRCANLDLLSMATSGNTDCFIAPHDSAFDKLSGVNLFEDDLIAIFPRSLENKPEVVTAADFEGWRYLAFNAHPSPGFEYELFFQPGGYVPRDVFRVESSTGIINLVVAGLGAAILPSWTTAATQEAALVSARRLASGPIPISWGIYSDAKPTHAKQGLLDAVVSVLKKAPG